MRRRFRHLFSFLFVAATLLSALHEVIHHHPQDIDGKYAQSCPLYVMAQTPVLPVEPFTLQYTESIRQPFVIPDSTHSTVVAIFLRNRSPPSV